MWWRAPLTLVVLLLVQGSASACGEYDAGRRYVMVNMEDASFLPIAEVLDLDGCPRERQPPTVWGQTVAWMSVRATSNVYAQQGAPHPVYVWADLVVGSAWSSDGLQVRRQVHSSYDYGPDIPTPTYVPGPHGIGIAGQTLYLASTNTSHVQRIDEFGGRLWTSTLQADERLVGPYRWNSVDDLVTIRSHREDSGQARHRQPLVTTRGTTLHDVRLEAAGPGGFVVASSDPSLHAFDWQLNHLGALPALAGPVLGGVSATGLVYGEEEGRTYSVVPGTRAWQETLFQARTNEEILPGGGPWFAMEVHDGQSWDNARGDGDDTTPNKTRPTPMAAWFACLAVAGALQLRMRWRTRKGLGGGQ